jgi:hypothetical protein
VLFTNVRDVVKLNKALNNVVFGNLKVWANMARYDRFGVVDFNNRERKQLRILELIRSTVVREKKESM